MTLDDCALFFTAVTDVPNVGLLLLTTSRENVEDDEESLGSVFGCSR
jgi:hypothetical protein